MDDKLAKKLRLQDGLKVLVLNAPQEYLDWIDQWSERIFLETRPDGKYDFVHVFIRDSGDYDDLCPMAMDAISYDGLFWMSYPKKSSKVKSDLSRDILWEMMNQTELRPVTQISIDETWSALRFRPKGEVGK
jgi:hypothetical protein